MSFCSVSLVLSISNWFGFMMRSNNSTDSWHSTKFFLPIFKSLLCLNYIINYFPFENTTLKSEVY